MIGMNSYNHGMICLTLEIQIMFLTLKGKNQCERAAEAYFWCLILNSVYFVYLSYCYFFASYWERLKEHVYAPDSKIHMSNMGPTWVLSAPGGPMLAPWTLLPGCAWKYTVLKSTWRILQISVFLWVMSPDNHCWGYTNILAFCNVVKSLELIWRSEPVDFNYGCPIFKWTAATSLDLKNSPR